jgi:hypothetical protein
MSNPTRKIVTPADLVPGNLSHCPECKAVAPAYGFVLNRYNLGVLGQIEYFTVFCAAPRTKLSVDPETRELKDPEVCGCILAVNIISYQPPTSPEQVEALMRQMRGEGPKQ